MTREEWENWKDDNSEDFEALKELAETENCDDALYHLISSDYVDSLAKSYIDELGWKMAYNLLKDIGESNSQYFELDESGTLSVADDWDTYADELEDSLVFDNE